MRRRIISSIGSAVYRPRLGSGMLQGVAIQVKERLRKDKQTTMQHACALSDRVERPTLQSVLQLCNIDSRMLDTAHGRVENDTAVYARRHKNVVTTQCSTLDRAVVAAVVFIIARKSTHRGYVRGYASLARPRLTLSRQYSRISQHFTALQSSGRFSLSSAASGILRGCCLSQQQR